MKKKRKPSETPLPARFSRGHALLLVLICFVAYANSLGGAFVWDDEFQVVRNETIRSFSNLPQAFNGSLWSFMYSEGGAGNEVFKRYYRPLHTVIYMVAYEIGGLSPFIFHFLNILIHSATTVFVYLLCIQLGMESIVALMAAGLFATHPVHTESVAWIAGVGDLACGMFFVAGLCAFVAYLKTQKTVFIWTSAAACLGALLSKEAGITFPIAAALLFLGIPHDISRRPNTVLSMVVPFGVAGALYAVLRVHAIGLSLAPAIQAQATLLDWGTLSIWVLGQYVRYAMLPYPLVAQHIVPLHFSDRIPSTLAFAGVLALAVALAWLGRKKMPSALVWLAIFGATLLPVLYFQGSGIFFAERYLYIPSVAAVILAGYVIQGRSKSGLIAITSLIGIFLILTVIRNKDWKDDETLYGRTLQVEPASVKFANNLGLMYLERGDSRHAQQYFDQASKYIDDPRFVQDVYEKYRVHLGLGILAARDQRSADAKALLNKALQFDPNGDGAYATLAGVLVNQDRDYANATALLNKALQINPKSELTRDYLGVALLNQGQNEQAVASFREALRINPNYEPARQHLEFALRIAKP